MKVSARNQRGFTLIEILVIIAIIGILAAVAVNGTVSWMSGMELKATARDLFSALQSARIKAIKTNQDITVVFKPAKNTYSIYSDYDATTDTGTLEFSDSVKSTRYEIGFGAGKVDSDKGFDPDDADGNATIDSDYVNYASNILTFNSRGIGNAGSVYLENDGGSVYAIGSSVSGSVLLRRWKGEGTWE